MDLKTQYLGLTVIVNILIFYFGYYAINQTSESIEVGNKNKIQLALGLLSYQAYVFILALTGVLETLDPPPRVVVFMIAPIFISNYFFLKRHKNRMWLQAIPNIWLVLFQSFRIVVETIFIFSIAEGILHPNVTIHGHNYDMIFAIIALVFGLSMLFIKMPTIAIKAFNFFRTSSISIRYLCLHEQHFHS